jgi:TRAP-type C4-dicarboxylate transport system substrate-binding protein
MTTIANIRGTRPAVALAGAIAMLLAVGTGRAAAEDKTYVMKLGLATINDSQHEWCKNFVKAVEKDSGGRIKGEIYPASQLGSIPREIEGVQFGSIQGYIGPPEFLVGVDERYEVVSTPGLVKDINHAVRMTEDPKLLKMMLSFGAAKGIHGTALFIAQPSSVISRVPIRHLADFKGKKLRVLAADMQKEMLTRLGATPVAMTLGDVLPAIQQGAIDGAVAAMTVYTTMHYYDAAKYITETNQPFIFSMAFISKKWYDALPKDLQKIIDEDGAKEAKVINPWEVDFFAKQRDVWAQHGELLSLPPDEHAKMMQIMASVGEDVAKRKEPLKEAYDVFAAAAKRTQ